VRMGTDFTQLPSSRWGESKREGGKYWIARHSGGTHWGEEGFFRIRRGANTLRIEEFCYWGTIRTPLVKQTHVCTD
jgi:hypothetical protein